MSALDLLVFFCEEGRGAGQWCQEFMRRKRRFLLKGKAAACAE